MYILIVIIINLTYGYYCLYDSFSYYSRAWDFEEVLVSYLFLMCFAKLNKLKI